jgi:hypothetical protein
MHGGCVRMKRVLIPLAIAMLMAFTAGCGQGDFAGVTVASFRFEENTSGNTFLVLSLEIENLTDSVLYIESASPANETGEKHLWFVLKDGDGNQYKPSYLKDIEDNILPPSASPNTSVSGDMAIEVPGKLPYMILEVTQDTVGGNDAKIIFTQEWSSSL